MEHRDYDYYEANVGDVRPEDITSSRHNATILQRLRDGDDTLQHITISRYDNEYNFAIRESDDLGWLGYFIRNSEYLQHLCIHYLPEGEGGEQRTHAFLGGIARNQSIRMLYVHGLSDYMFVAVTRVLGSLSRLEDLDLFRVNFDPNCCFALGTLLQTGVCKLKKLCICESNIGDDGVAAFTNGLASIGSSLKELDLCDIAIGNGGLSALVAALATCTSLESLDLSYNDFSLAATGMRSLLDWLQRAPMTLKHMRFEECGINDEGVQALVGAANHCETLNLSKNRANFGNDGLSALVAALATCTSLETLDLSGNDFSLAATGMLTLSDWLQRAPKTTTLKHMRLADCGINDEGLQALAQGAASHCETLDLSGNGPITVSGLRCLSTSLQSESCRVVHLQLGSMPIGDDGAKVLALGLVGNTSLRCLYLDNNEEGATTPAGWSAFSTALCDTTSVNNTYLSNHTLHELENIWEQIRSDDIVLYLQLNKEHPQHAAKCKILMNHPYLDMMPFFQWKLKFLPLAVDWFERARPCTTLSIYDDNSGRRRILVESDDAFQSRVLTAMYQFVRGMPMEVMKRREEFTIVAAYDDEIASLREELERRERKIKQLEEENDELSGIVEAVRNTVGV